MRISFLGDIAVSQPVDAACIDTTCLTDSDYVLANLEGAVLPTGEAAPENSGSKALTNSEDVLDVLRLCRVNSVYLANNHIYDVPLPASHTRQLLSNAGIASFGAGANLNEANQSFDCAAGDTKVRIFTFGWNVIGCHPAGPGSEGTNPLTPEHAFRTIREVRAADTSSCVIYVMHWNYEMELYPQPAHRQLAHDLLEAGVDAIIGMHSHVAQGVENVGGKFIVHGLGNWYFPPRQLGPVKLKFPDVCNRELAVELRLRERTVEELKVHWHRFVPEEQKLCFEKTEQHDGDDIRALTPYAGMGHQEYIRWFKENRIKRRSLPVYRDYRSTARNYMNDSYVLMRQRAIGLLVDARLKGGPRAN